MARAMVKEKKVVQNAMDVAVVGLEGQLEKMIIEYRKYQMALTAVWKNQLKKVAIPIAL